MCSLYSIYMCMKLCGTKGIKDVALNKKIKFVCLFVCIIMLLHSFLQIVSFREALKPDSIALVVYMYLANLINIVTPSCYFEGTIPLAAKPEVPQNRMIAN